MSNYDPPDASRGSSEKRQSAICYALDGDQVDTLELLVQHFEDHWFPWNSRIPLLYTAVERGKDPCAKANLNFQRKNLTSSLISLDFVRFKYSNVFSFIGTTNSTFRLNSILLYHDSPFLIRGLAMYPVPRGRALG